MSVVPGNLPSWVSPSRLLTVAYGLGLTSCVAPWTLLMLHWAAPRNAVSSLDWVGEGDSTALGVGFLLTMATIAMTSHVVGRVRSSGWAVVASIAGTSVALAIPHTAAMVASFGIGPQRDPV